MKRIILLSLLSSLLLLGACKTDFQSLAKVDANDSVAAVHIAQVEEVKSLPGIEAVGSLRALSERKLSFKIGGVLARLQAKEGQMVRKGQVLAILDKSEINAQVQKASENVQKLERDLQRTQNLYNEQAATLENVQDLTTAVQVAKSDLQIAKFNQQYAVITAPVGGKILQRFAEEGELVAPGSPIFLIAEAKRSEMLFHCYLSDKDIVQLKVGDGAKVHLDAYPNKVFDGIVSNLAIQPDPRTLTYDVEIRLPELDNKARTGFIGTALLAPSQEQPMYRIPMQAVIEANAEEAIVFAAAKNKKAIRFVVHPSEIENNSILTHTPIDLQHISGVITASTKTLKEGQNIEIVTTSKN